MGVEAINPWHLPLLNAMVLLASGISVTWAHHAILAKKDFESLISLFITIVLGVIFCALMLLEYYTAPFAISDSVYGSGFFMLTGLHFLHMIIGTIFLIVMMGRIFKHHFSLQSVLGAELSILYWHFVDLVFLFVFTGIYY